VVVETPVSLNSEQKDLLKKFEESLQKGTHQPRERSFFEGVKKFFTDGVD
jgi:molecular chaperone DnaJ